MLCDKCEKLLDLDTSFPPDSHVEGGPRIAHHESYSTLRQAARAGCEFCQLIVENYRGGSQEMPSPILPGSKWEVSVEFFHDSIIVNIPMRIDYDESAQDKSKEGYEFGEDIIRLYIYTEHSQFTPLHELFTFDFVGDPLAALFSMRPLSEDSSSDGCFEIASMWLQKCLDTHDECPKQPSPLPSRVIDVGSDGRDPFLHISKDECGLWLAMSHCWGLEQNFTTTSSTLDLFSQSIPMADLPETFKDAILITRRLGYQYVWVDSLCIVQDSQEDWEAESQNMAIIYQNATATISADAANGDRQGIFKGVKSRRDKFKLLALPYHSLKRGLRGKMFVSVRQGRHDFKTMPLQTRAWVLQEKALSVRSLRYQHTGLFWHCQTATSTEVRPSLVQRHLDIKELHTIPHKSLPARIDYDIHYQLYGDPATLAWWYIQVSDYTTRQLTFKKDRFPAIAGLAREFADRTGYHYMAGIWMEDFQRGLLWKGAVPESYYGLCPSWSWVGAEFNEQLGRVYEGNRFLRHGKNFVAELISFSEPKAADVFLGGGAATILTLRGWRKGIREFIAGKQFYHFSFSAKPGLEPLEPAILHLRSSPFSKDGQDENMALFWPDKQFNIATAPVILAEKKAVILRISDFETWDAGNPHIFNTYGLLLEPTGRPDGTYQRIGLVAIPSGNPAASIEGFDLRTIRIA
jgi:hypothetical protein